MALFVAALAIWFAVRVVDVLLVLFIAILFAVYLSAVTDLLGRRLHVPRWLGLTLAVGGTLAAVAGLGAVLLPPVIDQTQSLIAGLPGTLAEVQNVIAHWAARYPVLRRSALADPTSGLVGSLITETMGYLRASILPYIRAGGLALIEGVSVFVLALYLARNPSLYRNGVVSLVPPRHRATAARILDDAGQTLRAWVGGQMLSMVALGTLTTLGLLILGTPYWLAFGVFAGAAAIVPFFGTLLSTVLPALFVVSTGDWVKVVAVLLLGVLVHVVEANVVGPLIMERKVALPPVLTITSVLVMGTLLGIVGLIVAVPVLAIAVVFVRHVVHGGIYGDAATEPAVLRHTGEFRLPMARPKRPSRS
ncbi:MAG TPA: AI-2E family transporter [Candidatus Sulfotelmatobacter sp.]|nr:AI-2E family transporter [Candidatus Sulfotelmatobacter sp.]